jgi:hypothetical protein
MALRADDHPCHPPGDHRDGGVTGQRFAARFRYLTDNPLRLVQRLEGVRRDIAVRQDTSGDKFPMHHDF